MTTNTERGNYLAGLLNNVRARVADGNRNAVVFDRPVRIMSVATTGVRCRFPDGHIERIHPEDIH